MVASAKFRVMVLGALIALACALLTPVIDRAGAETNNGGGGKVTCSGGGMPDGEPGDVNTVNTYTYINGKYVAKTTVRMICGNDGLWHIIATRTGAPGQSFPVVSAPGRSLGG